MSGLTLKEITVHYDGQDEPAVSRASLSIASGEFVVLTGRSGCGKTTLLNVAAGFVRPEEGEAAVDGTPITAPGSERAVVFQNDALFPWLDARGNVAFALRMRGAARTEREVRAQNLLAQVGLENAGAKPVWELSGGMRQRVGLARALAADPAFLLMDEPLGALDALTRERMQTLLLDLWRDTRVGVLMVTHGIEEALLLATKIVVMAPGPGHVVREIAVDFSRRYAAGESIRSIRADPDFIAGRADLAHTILEREPT